MLQCFCWILHCSSQRTVHNDADRCQKLVHVRWRRWRQNAKAASFHSWEVFPTNSASNGAACSIVSLLLETTRKNTSQCPELRNTYGQVTKRDSFRPLTITLSWKLLVTCPVSIHQDLTNVLIFKCWPIAIMLTNCKCCPWRNSLQPFLVEKYFGASCKKR